MLTNQKLQLIDCLLLIDQTYGPSNTAYQVTSFIKYIIDVNPDNVETLPSPWAINNPRTNLSRSLARALAVLNDIETLPNTRINFGPILSMYDNV